FYLERSAEGANRFQGYEFLVISILICGFLMLRDDKDSRRPSTFMSTMFGILYAPFLLQFLILILNLPGNDRQGLALGLWTIAVIKFTDVGALLTGRRWGRTPFAPTISPKKTWEGVFGGLATAVVLGI